MGMTRNPQGVLGGGIVILTLLLVSPPRALAQCNDADGDGWGDPGDATCPGGPDSDCDDTDPGTYPGAAEVCDGLDNDCDGVVPSDEVDDDGDGFDECAGGDCDDADPDTFPLAPELCDGLDNDCDGMVPSDEVDDDGDGFDECTGGDCDDADPGVFPGAPELCDGLDNDCDGTVDNGVGDDADADGFTPCEGDCDDADEETYPGAPELCDGVDNDCDGGIDDGVTEDLDGDGFTPCTGDCDDDDPGVSPVAEENCGDGLDNDCDGAIDDLDEDCEDLPPVAAAGDDLRIVATAGDVVLIDIDGSASANPNGSALLYQWSLDEAPDAADAFTHLVTEERSPRAFLMIRPSASAPGELSATLSLTVVEDAEDGLTGGPDPLTVEISVEPGEQATPWQCAAGGGSSRSTPLLTMLSLLLFVVIRRVAACSPRQGWAWPGAALLAALVLGAPSPSRAGEDTPKPAAWLAPPPDALYVPLAKPLPEGKGALLVPSLTGGDDEPDVLLVTDQSVQRIGVGQRVVVDPGRYVVLVGSADPTISAGVTVEVQPGHTTVAPVVWGGLDVQVVNRRLKSFGGRYDLVHVESGLEVVLPPELREGASRPETWLLAPGLYRLQEPDMSTTERHGFATVYVPAGGLVTFRLFMDPASGRFLGGGVIPVDDDRVEEPPESPWDVSLAMGLDGSFSGTRNQIGWADQSALDGSAFVDFRAQFDSPHHGLEFRLGVEEGATWLRPSGGVPMPPLKSRDWLGGGLRYSFKFNEGLGLYARGFGETRLFPTTAVTAVDQTIAFRRLDGTVDYEVHNAPESYRIADAWKPTVIRAGGGFEPAVVRSQPVDLTFRIGGDYRAYLFDGVFRPDDNPDTPVLEYTELSTRQLGGFVGGMSFAVRAAGWFSYTTEFEAFVVPSATPQVILEWDNTIGLSITRHLSLNYRVLLERMPYAGPGLQLQHGAYLRFTWSVL